MAILLDVHNGRDGKGNQRDQDAQSGSEEDIIDL
jgi:hypothetical protein